MSNTEQRLQCPYCARLFGGADARYSHARVKHKGLPLKAIFPERKKLRAARKSKPNDDLSLAEIAVEASWKRAAGERLDELEQSLLS